MNCAICNDNFEGRLDRLHYCLCDTCVCDSCVKTSDKIKKDDKNWVCPKCKMENDLEKSMLFRAQ